MNRARHRRTPMVATLCALIACAAPAAHSSPAQLEQPATKNDTPRTITDDVGRRVRVPVEVKRIVTLAPNLTEEVYDLGLGDHLAGDTEWCDTPAEAKTKPHVGNPQNPSLEAIVALRPDVVLATTSINFVQTADALQQIGIPVYTSDSQTVRGMLASLARMAEVLGAKAQGSELTARLEQRLDALTSRLAERPLVHVLFVVWDQPLTTIGQNTFIADELRFAGAESVVLSDQSWPRLSLEEVVRLQPEYLIFASQHGDVSEEIHNLRTRPVWKDLAAVQGGHVVDIGEEAIRPAPGMVDAIEKLARQLHPEVFQDKSEIRNSKSELRFALQPMTEIIQECALCGR